MRAPMPSARLATIALGFACLCACKPPLAKDMPTESDLGRGRKLPRETSHADAGTKAPAGLLAHIVASVPEHTVGPLLARGPGGAMAAYLGASPNGARRVVSIPLRTDDSALEATSSLPPAPTPRASRFAHREAAVTASSRRGPTSPTAARRSSSQA